MPCPKDGEVHWPGGLAIMLTQLAKEVIQQVQTTSFRHCQRRTTIKYTKHTETVKNTLRLELTPF